MYVYFLHVFVVVHLVFFSFRVWCIRCLPCISAAQGSISSWSCKWLSLWSCLQVTFTYFGHRWTYYSLDKELWQTTRFRQRSLGCYLRVVGWQSCIYSPVIEQWQYDSYSSYGGRRNPFSSMLLGLRHHYSTDTGRWYFSQLLIYGQQVAYSSSGIRLCRCISIQIQARNILVWQTAAYWLPACRAGAGIRGIGTRLSLCRLLWRRERWFGVCFAEEESDDDIETCSGNVDGVDFAPLWCARVPYEKKKVCPEMV